MGTTLFVRPTHARRLQANSAHERDSLREKLEARNTAAVENTHERPRPSSSSHPDPQQQTHVRTPVMDYRNQHHQPTGNPLGVQQLFLPQYGGVPGVPMGKGPNDGASHMHSLCRRFYAPSLPYTPLSPLTTPTSSARVPMGGGLGNEKKRENNVVPFTLFSREGVR